MPFEKNENISEYLNTDIKTGLTETEALERLKIFGKNEIIEHKQNSFLKFLCYFIDPISILIIIAFIFSGIVQDWANFGVIGGLLLLNAFIGWSMETRAESAIEGLKKTLSLKSTCIREGEAKKIDSTNLVVGDIISLRIGDIVPADCRLLGVNISGEECSTITVDQSTLTGESLPVIKGKDKIALSSSIIKQSQMMAIVTKTGIGTLIGKTVKLISVTNEQGHFQKIVNQIGKFLVLSTMALITILFIYLITMTKDKNFLVIIDNIVVLAVAAIPVGLPTVLSVTMAVGAKQLAYNKVIIKRLPAIEELASVSIICSDKTGTLTKNELSLDEPYICNGYSELDLFTYAYLASEKNTNDPIELVVRNNVESKVNRDYLNGFKISEFVPFNPDSKQTTATVQNLITNEQFRVTKGAPAIITKLTGFNDGNKIIDGFAAKGLRTLGVARTYQEQWHLVGYLTLLDPPREDSAETISRCHEYGVEVKMITGDQISIAKEVCYRLNMNRCIVDAQIFDDTNEEKLKTVCLKADGFANTKPDHKFQIVELLKDSDHLVAMTGDGVNDAPALKKANVGIAVHNCTDAARSASDIVLLSPGLSTIINSITTARTIFQRMRSYSLYRITSTIHILIFFFFIILIEQWKMNPSLLILIAVLNDLATIVIAFDNAQISNKPDKWRVGQLIFVSIILGLFLTASSFGHFYIAREVFKIDDKKLQTIMYLHISSCPHFLIFATRVNGFFWSNIPSILFIVAILATQIFAIIISIFGIPGFIEPIGPAWAFSIIAVSLGYFVFSDFIKFVIFKYWSYELTILFFPIPSRKLKLDQKKINKIKNARIDKNLEKIRNVDNLVKVIFAFAL